MEKKDKDYEKYLLDKIEGYKKTLKEGFSGTSRVREVLEFELEQFELRLFNFKKGKKQTIEEVLRLFDTTKEFSSLTKLRILDLIKKELNLEELNLEGKFFSSQP